MDNLTKSKFKVNIKSLFTEAKFIRQEEKKYKDSWERNCLRDHRVQALRKESRITQVAYAFARGKPYNSVEPSTKNPLTPEDVHRIILKLKRKGIDTTKSELLEWLN